MTAFRGDSLTLECQVMNSDTIDWYFQDGPLEENENISIINKDNGVSQLVLDDVSVEQEGWYSAKSGNEVGCAEVKTHVDVIGES